MIKNIARTSGGLLGLLAITTACAVPAPPRDTSGVASAQTAPIVVQTAPMIAMETPAAALQPTTTEPVVAASEPAGPTAVAVEAPEKETPLVGSPAAEERSGPTDEQQWVLDGLPSLGQAPELRNEVWLNSEPLRLADLRGQVVLLDMWTFG